MENKKIKVGIFGGAGYTGGELMRILINHPAVSISFIHSRSQAGKPVSHTHSDLLGETDLTFSADLSFDVDVIFLCVGHGEGKVFLELNEVPQSVRVIDLSQDFRIKGKAASREFVYGLPELNREFIRTAKNISNPGCFATAIQLALLPLAKAGMLANVNTTGITGSTGAGQSLSPTSHFSWRANNIQAYKTLSHQHLNEIMNTLASIGSVSPEIYFVPWRGDFTRGIFTSNVVDCELELDAVRHLYESFYDDHPFTVVSNGSIELKQVVNTNKCVIGLEKAGSKLVVHSAIDNLLKGASGQAVQNMNLMMGIEEKSGLQLKATVF